MSSVACSGDVLSSPCSSRYLSSANIALPRGRSVPATLPVDHQPCWP